MTPQSDRYGYRLAGPTLSAVRAIEKRSHGIVPGVIQVPHNGQPIIQLRDAQPSGGYPKIGTVIEADLWRLAQARIGTKLRFVQTTYPEAVAALEEVERYLAQGSQPGRPFSRFQTLKHDTENRSAGQRTSADHLVAD